MKPFACAAFLVTLASSIGITMSPPARQTPSIRVRTELVTLPVTVVDRHGTLVSGLRREHLTVYEENEPRPIEVFTSDDVPATIGLVIDSSGSMRVHRAAVTAAATAFLNISHPLDEFFTINFNDVAWSSLPRELAFTQDRNELQAALDAAPAQGRTALYDAVDRALDQLEHGSRDRKAAIVVSDGGDNASRHSLESVQDHARRTAVLIYSVTLVDPDDHEAHPRVMKQLAADSGGRAFAPKREADVMDAFDSIAREIRSVYTIGFSPADTGREGFRSIRVVADAGDGRRLIARTRAGYYYEEPGEELGAK
jgi:Ca-activated chloride channel homolog